MPHVISDRVLEASTSSGTGPFALSGAVLGYRAFSAVCAIADTVPYYIEAVDAQGRPTGDWEFGLGTYTAANQLTRTTIRGSSNGGLAVSFPAGTKLVGLGVPAPNSAATRAEWRASLGFTPTGEALATAASAAVVQALLLINQPRVDVPSAATLNLITAAAATDHINITGTTAITAFTIPAGRTVFVRFAGALTLTNNASIVTQTGANITTAAGDTCILRATAANVVEVLCYTALSKVNLGASVATTSGTAIDFTGIPSWANRVTVSLVDVSTNGASQVQLQIGAGSVATSGYSGVTDTQSTAGGSTGAPISGLVLERSGIGGATITRSGVAVFSRVSGNRWVGTYTGAFIAGSAFIAWAASTINLGGSLDRVRLTTVNGTDAFDAGSVNISWE